MPLRSRHWNCYVTISVTCNECAGQMTFGEVDSVWTSCVRSIKAELMAISGLLHGLYSSLCARASASNQWICKVCHNKPFLLRKYCIKLRGENSVNYLQIKPHGYQHRKTAGFSGNHLRDTIMVVLHLCFCQYPFMCFSYGNGNTTINGISNTDYTNDRNCTITNKDTSNTQLSQINTYMLMHHYD